MILTLDVENTVVKRNGKLHLDPFEPENTLVMVGMLDDNNNETIITFDHSEQTPTANGRAIVQDTLDKTRLLVAHNAPHDLLWLWESGFTYDGDVFDTCGMLRSKLFKMPGESLFDPECMFWIEKFPCGLS